MSRSSPTGSTLPPDWDQRIPADEWAVYRDVIQRARARRIRFAVGGAFATAVYTDDFRNTKDFDFYLLPEDREPMKKVMLEAGLQDYFERLPYDRSWIYRGNRNDIIVDAIWAMANHRAVVDESWLNRGPEITLRGERLRAIPVEELIWCKLYILQRGRCDWVDVFNLIDARGAALDWEHLLHQLESDIPLLAGAMSAFSWLAPDRVRTIPQSVWPRLGLGVPPAQDDPELSRARADLLDSRPWFRRNSR